jgi:hypothetical protein
MLRHVAAHSLRLEGCMCGESVRTLKGNYPGMVVRRAMARGSQKSTMSAQVLLSSSRECEREEEESRR